MNIFELTEKLNCTIWPESWHNIYGEAIKKYEAEGLPCATEEYYDKLEEKYGIFGDKLNSFKRAAKAISKNEDLKKLLAVVSYSMNSLCEFANFVPPTAPEGEDPIAYDMIIGLAVCSHIERTYESMQKRGIPREQIFGALRYFTEGLTSFRQVYHRDGYMGYWWQNRVVNSNIIPVGCFNTEVLGEMNAGAVVFANKKGESIALAYDRTFHKSGFPLGSKHFEDEEGSFYVSVDETDDSYIGYPYLENGYVSKEKITLSKSEWEKKISPLDRVIKLHIPRGTKFTPEVIRKSLDEIVEFVKKYFPEENPKAIACFSWLCDPQLAEILPETSNIANFGKIFTRFAQKNDGKDALKFVFSIADDNPDFDSLPEDTSLYRALKAHYKSGKAIYTTSGYILI